MSRLFAKYFSFVIDIYYLSCQMAYLYTNIDTPPHHDKEYARVMTSREVREVV